MVRLQQPSLLGLSNSRNSGSRWSYFPYIKHLYTSSLLDFSSSVLLTLPLMTCAAVRTSWTVCRSRPNHMTVLARPRKRERRARRVFKLMLKSILERLFGSFLIQAQRRHSLMDHLSLGSTTSRPRTKSLASLDTWRQSFSINSHSPVRIFSKRADWLSSRNGG